MCRLVSHSVVVGVMMYEMSTAILSGARDQGALGIVGGRRWRISEMDGGR